MAELEIRNSIKAFYNDTSLRKAVVALSEVLQGDNPPKMDWGEARNYNQALLTAAQVRADHNDLLFDLWERTFGNAWKQTRGKYEVDFEPDSCTPEFMWDEGIVWQSMSRNGLEQPGLIHSFELHACIEHKLVYLSVAGWNHKQLTHVDIDFDPAAIGNGKKWQSFEDEEGDVVARTPPISISDFISNPAKFVVELQASAGEMMECLVKKV